MENYFIILSRKLWDSSSSKPPLPPPKKKRRYAPTQRFILAILEALNNKTICAKKSIIYEQKI